MFSAFINIFKISDLRKKVIITLLLLIACRIGAHIPIPCVDADKVFAYFKSLGQGGLFGMINMFSGGALQKGSVFALGIMPYISASIIMQLLTVVVPSLEKLAKEGGEEGRKKINQYTRYGSVLLCVIQGYMTSGIAIGMNASMPGAVLDPGLSFRLMAIITMTTGTVFLMWVGEQITERGIGNGISLIITVNIVSRIPSAVGETWRKLSFGKIYGPRQLEPEWLIVLLMLFVFVVAMIILITQGQRKIPVQYAKRIVGRRMYTGQSSYIPLRVNYAGVIPIIFASAILMFPATLAVTNIEIFQKLAALFMPGTALYLLTFVLMIVFFTYFWTATVFDPVKMGNDMKKNGAFIPGIRPGKPTSAFFEKTMNRLTLSGALFLAAVAVLPQIITRSIGGVSFSMAQFFGGTGVLIIVGVTLDTMRAIEAHLLMRHYDGFLKKGKLRGRY